MTLPQNLVRAMRIIVSEWDDLHIEDAPAMGASVEVLRGYVTREDGRAKVKRKVGGRKPASDVPATTRDRVKHRAGALCEARTPACEGWGRQIHHRGGRGFDGCHNEDLLLLVCGLGNATGCHGLIHSHPDWARRHGLLVDHGDLSPMSAVVGCPLSCEVDHRLLHRETV